MTMLASFVLAFFVFGDNFWFYVSKVALKRFDDASKFIRKYELLFDDYLFAIIYQRRMCWRVTVDYLELVGSKPPPGKNFGSRRSLSDSNW